MERLTRFIAFFTFFVIFLQAAFAVDYSAATKRLLARTEVMLRESRRLSKPLEVPRRLCRQFLIRSFNGEACIGALVRVDSDLDESDLLSRRITVRRKVGELWSVTIPLRALEEVKDLDGIDWIEIDIPIRKRLDLAGADVKSDKVHQGIDLPHAYTGTNVVIGLIDGGYDYTHPAFQDANGDCRIRAVWDQADESGLPPDGFGYGSEYTDSDAIQDKAHDIEGTEDSHGSHVCGIAGGRAADGAGLYTGMAPDVDLVLVSLGGGPSDVWDGIEYVFNYATKENRSAVVNMSLGHHIGPHDGTSLMDQAFDRVAGSGKILIGAAGNEADEQLHISHSFSSDTMATCPYMSYDEDEDAEFATIEIWGSPNTSMSVAGGLFDTESGVLVAQSTFYASDGTEYEEETYYDDIDGQASLSIGAVAEHPYNQRPNIQVEFMNTTSYAIVLYVTSASSTVHLWHVDEAPFQDLGFPELFRAGDSEYTVGEIGGTGKSVVSVGAYSTKNIYTDINGQQQIIGTYTEIGELAPFSSHGPTLDGRIKPEITSPGNVIVSSTSSYDTETTQTEELIVEIVESQWPYAAFEGTSMSAPVVAGIVALMLEANQNLTKDQIVDIFRQTAREDGFTGNIPDAGSNRWGYGKIDAHEAVKMAADYTAVTKSLNRSVNSFTLYNNFPNPFNPETRITYRLAKAGQVRLTVLDPLGREKAVLLEERQSAGIHSIPVNGEEWTSGVYIYRLESRGEVLCRKMLLLK